MVLITIDTALLSTTIFSSSGISFVNSAVVFKNRIIMFRKILMLIVRVDVSVSWTLISDVMKNGS